MRRRTLPLIALLWFAAVAFAQDQPNIVFLISDDHSAPHLGCYGDTVIQTPNLDRLAAGGIRFDKAFVASPQCSPSRSSVMTGQPPHTTGTSRLHSPLRPNIPNLITLLKQNGYHTGIFKKLHLGPFVKEFDFHQNSKNWSHFFDARPKHKPFFLWIGFTDPHRDYKPGAFNPPHDPQRLTIPPTMVDTPVTRRDLALHYDAIARMDKDSGDILGLLDKHGLAENTLVFFFGDNGMPFPGGKGTLYDPGINVPLIARWPGRINPGRSTAALISIADLMPTCLEAVGVAPPSGIQARSMLKLLLDHPHEPRSEIFAERNWHDTFDIARCVRTERYKLIHNHLTHLPYQTIADAARSPSWQELLRLHREGALPAQLEERYFRAPRPPFELYDLQTDPLETKNLADDPDHAPVLRDLQEKLRQWMEATNDFAPPPRMPAPRRAAG